jgi:hypothetical protein
MKQLQTIDDLLANLTPEMFMAIWGDDTITNVTNMTNRLYTVDQQMISHGEAITLRLSVKVSQLITGAVQCEVLNVLELCRQPIN